MHTTIEILGALIARQQTGAGRIVDVSIHGAATQWSMFPTTADLTSACYTMYETADGQWLAPCARLALGQPAGQCAPDVALRARDLRTDR